jgi:hypothetical protein
MSKRRYKKPAKPDPWAKPNPGSGLASMLNDILPGFGQSLDQRPQELLPAEDDIPAEYSKPDHPWHIFWAAVLEKGDIMRAQALTPKEGINLSPALTQVIAIVHNQTPSAKHKLAGLAYLSSLWFEPIDDDQE